jgi:hypothetical protein
MRRRDFIRLVGGATAAWPLMARAQQAPKVVGLLDPGVPLLFGAFLQGMRDLGHVEGQSLRYVRRSAEGNVERIPALANESHWLGAGRDRNCGATAGAYASGSDLDYPHRVRSALGCHYIRRRR